MRSGNRSGRGSGSSVLGIIGRSSRAKHRLKSGKGTAVNDLIRTFMTTSELYSDGLN